MLSSLLVARQRVKQWPGLLVFVSDGSIIMSEAKSLAQPVSASVSSVVVATLGMSGWLDFAQQGGLSSGKKRQAWLGAANERGQRRLGFSRCPLHRRVTQNVSIQERSARLVGPIMPAARVPSVLRAPIRRANRTDRPRFCRRKRE